MIERNPFRLLATNARDYAVARGIAGLSAACSWAPNTIGRLIVGDNPDAVRWHLAKTRADKVFGWKTVPGDPSSGWRPVSYKSSAVLYTDKARLKLAARSESGSGVPAAAFRVGKYVLVSALRSRSDFLPVPYDHSQTPPAVTDLAERELGDDRVSVIMGVGNRALHATLCAYNASENTITSTAAPVMVTEQRGIPPRELAVMPVLSAVPIV